MAANTVTAPGVQAMSTIAGTSRDLRSGRHTAALLAPGTSLLLDGRDDGQSCLVHGPDRAREPLVVEAAPRPRVSVRSLYQAQRFEMPEVLSNLVNHVTSPFPRLVLVEVRADCDFA